VPAAMSVRCSLWPLCDSLKSSVQVLGCPNCLTKKKAAPLLKFSEQHKINRVLIERSDPFCTYVPKLQLEKIAVKAHAVYSLPGYIDSSVIEYPLILRRWADVLGR
jgi:hypothetical protein